MSTKECRNDVSVKSRRRMAAKFYESSSISRGQQTAFLSDVAMRRVDHANRGQSQQYITRIHEAISCPSVNPCRLPACAGIFRFTVDWLFIDFLVLRDVFEQYMLTYFTAPSTQD